jgi:hypothetical protein
VWADACALLGWNHLPPGVRDWFALKQTEEEDKSAGDQIDPNACPDKVDVHACLVDESEKHAADRKFGEGRGEGIGEAGQCDILWP